MILLKIGKNLHLIGSSSDISYISVISTQQLQYLPFGELFVEQRDNANYFTSYKFSAKEKDEETSYFYFGARYLASDFSFWLSVDPMADKYPNISPYAYCAWNPVMLVDPDGRESFEIDQESGKVKIVDKSQHYQAKNGSIISVKEGETYNGTENISEMKQIDKVSNSGGDNIYVSKGILDKKQNSNDYQMFSFRDANEASDFYYFAAGSTKAEYAFAELENKGGIVGTDFSDKNTKMTGFFEQNFGSQISLISHSHGGSGWPPSFDITDKNHRQVGDLNNAASSSYSFQREVYSVPNKMVYGYNGMTLGKARRTGISYDYNFKRR